MIVCLRREYSNHNGANDEREARQGVPPDEGSATTEAVDEPDAQRLTDERNDRVPGLQPQRS